MQEMVVADTNVLRERQALRELAIGFERLQQVATETGVLKK